MRQKIRSIAVLLVVVVLMMQFLSHAGAVNKSYNLSNGSIEISSETISFCDSSGKSQIDTYKSGFAGDVILISQTDKLSTNCITVKDSAAVNLNLESLFISNPFKDDFCAFSIEVGSKVYLTLSGSNILYSGRNKAGISVPAGAELVISGTGNTDMIDSLTVCGGSGGAGIGGNNGITCGTITINSGSIDADGGHTSGNGRVLPDACGAGIGGGAHGNGGTITINNGNIGAGSLNGAGIGGGDGGGGGVINIHGGSVGASAFEGAGIGSGESGSGGIVNITNGTVFASSENNAGIGSDLFDAGGEINISGGIVSAMFSEYGVCLGANSGAINISGGTVTFGINSNVNEFNGAKPNNGTVVISGGTVRTDFTGETPTNGKNRVYLTTITIRDLSDFDNFGVYSWRLYNTPHLVSYSINGASPTSCYTDRNGKLYLWLPATPANSQTYINITYGNEKYTATGTINADNTNKITAVADAANNGISAIPTNCIIATETQYDSSGHSMYIVSAASVNEAFANAAIKRSQNGNRPVMMSIEGIATISKSAFQILASSDIQTLTITTSCGTITMDAKALDSLYNELSDSVVFTLKLGSASFLSTDTKNSPGAGDTVYRLTIKTGTKLISSIDDGKLTITAPYSHSDSMDMNQTVIYAVSPDGSLILIPASEFNTEKSALIFKTSETGSFVVKNSSVSFSDVSGWSEGYISFLSARGVINGTGNGAFSPNAHMSRAQFVTILAKLSGDDLSGYTASSYPDVSRTDWFFPAVEWAFEKGISSDTSVNFFPDTDITREDIAVMLTCYAEKIADFSLPRAMPAADFIDHTNISSYAIDSVLTMQMAGIVSGRPDGSFDPSGFATRAEAAKMIALFLKYIIIC